MVRRRPGADEDDDDALPPATGPDNKGAAKHSNQRSRAIGDVRPMKLPVGAIPSKAPPTSKELQMAPGSYSAETRTHPMQQGGVENQKRASDYSGRASRPGAVAVGGNNTNAKRISDQSTGKDGKKEALRMAPGEYSPHNEALRKPHPNTKLHNTKMKADPSARASRPGPVSIPGNSPDAHRFSDKVEAKQRQNGGLKMAPSQHVSVGESQQQHANLGKPDDRKRKSGPSTGATQPGVLAVPGHEKQQEKVDKTLRLAPGVYNKDDEKEAAKKDDFDKKHSDAQDSTASRTIATSTTRTSTGSSGNHRTSRRTSDAEDDEEIASVSSEEEDEDMVPGARAVEGLRGSRNDSYDPTASTTEASRETDKAMAGLVEALPVNEEDEVLEEEMDDKELMKNAVVAEEIDEEEMEGGAKGWIGRHKRLTGFSVLLVIALIAVGVVLATSGSDSPGDDASPPPETVERISKEEEALQQQSERFREAYGILANFTSPDILLFDEASPQHQALLWIADDDPAELDFDTTDSDLVAQRYGLAVLYFSTAGDEWANSFDFLIKPNECEWMETDDSNRQFGIAGCDEDGFITSILLPSNNLNGTIPGEISIMSSLKVLDMGSNFLAGGIPLSIGDLSMLTSLVLSSNSLTGRIPANIGNLTSLETLFFQTNALSGEIPSSIGSLTHLSSLYVSFNKLTGTIPPEIGQLTALGILFAQHNELSGSMPTSMNMLNDLRQIDVSYNLIADGADNLCNISSLVRFVADCYGQLIPAIERELCCSCCSLCCSASLDNCAAETGGDAAC